MDHTNAKPIHSESIVPSAMKVKVNNLTRDARLYILNRNVLRVNNSNYSQAKVLTLSLFAVGASLSLSALYNELTMWSLMSGRVQAIVCVIGISLLMLWSGIALTTAFYVDSVKLGKQSEFVTKLTARELDKLKDTQLSVDGRMSLAVSKEVKKRARAFENATTRNLHV